MTTQFNKLHYDTKNFRKETNQQFVITPQFASDLLTLNVGNRPVRYRFVEAIAAEMTEGTYIYTGEPIIISSDGKLIQGQHRLLAIQKSQVAQKMVIQTGIAPAAYDKLDNGFIRSTPDIAAHLGFKNSSQAAYLTRFMIGVEKTVPGSNYKIFSDNASGKITNTQVSTWLSTKNHEYINECITMGRNYHKDFHAMKANQFAALYYWFGLKNKEKADEFLTILSTGEDCSSSHNSAIYHLRQKMINHSQANAVLKGFEKLSGTKLALIVKSYNLFLKKTEVKKLVFTENEYPMPLTNVTFK